MNVVSLDSIKGIGELNAGKAGGCASSCGGGAPADLPAHVLEKIRNHPCYSEEAHHYFARMHLAVAPACNIQCNYCNRKFDCANESRPGVVSERLTPDEAVLKALAVAAEVPQLSVIGIAGPGDSLAAGGKATLDTFRRLAEHLPDVKFCLSTNGLALPDHIQALRDLAIDHVTITINMIDPEVGERIYPWIYFDGKRRTGREAARILHERQMEGLEALASAGILVKINSVLIPGVNDEHLSDVNAAVRAKGAFLHNIMPLISDPAHGTHFGLTGQRGPTTSELKAVQDRCEGSIKLMRHCRQCRADAIGLLGHDRGDEFSKEKVAVMPERDGAEDRAAYRLHVEEERAERERIREAASAEAADHMAVAPILIAVATKGGNRINEHFGHAREFQVYEVGPSGATFVGHRRVDHYCSDGYGEEEVLPATIRALADCRAVLVAKIGSCPSKSLTEAGIEPVDRYAYEFIEESALAYFAAFADAMKTGTLRPVPAADGAIRQGAFVARRA
jgi:nitrogen fixation protein NifB